MTETKIVAEKTQAERLAALNELYSHARSGGSVSETALETLANIATAGNRDAQLLIDLIDFLNQYQSTN